MSRHPDRIAQGEKVAKAIASAVTAPGAAVPGATFNGIAGDWQLIIFVKDTGRTLLRLRRTSLLDCLDELAGEVESMRRTGAWWAA